LGSFKQDMSPVPLSVSSVQGDECYHDGGPLKFSSSYKLQVDIQTSYIYGHLLVTFGYIWDYTFHK